MMSAGGSDPFVIDRYPVPDYRMVREFLQCTNESCDTCSNSNFFDE